MPIYHVGDLVNPRDYLGLGPEGDNPDAIGLIVEMRSMTGRQPEARILWNDLLDQGPKWSLISDIQPLEQQACNPSGPVV